MSPPAMLEIGRASCRVGALGAVVAVALKDKVDGGFGVLAGPTATAEATTTLRFRPEFFRAVTTSVYTESPSTPLAKLAALVPLATVTFATVKPVTASLKVNV